MSNIIEFTTTGTDTQDILLQSADTVNAPTTLLADQGVVETITGSVTSATAGSTNSDGDTVAANQPLFVSGPGTIVLANATATPNTWTGGTTVDAGGTLSIDSFAEIGTGDITLGDASASGTLTLTNTSTPQTTSQVVALNAGGGTIDVENAAASDTVYGFTGSGSLTKTGDGTLVVSTISSGGNDYLPSSGITVSGGALSFSGSDTFYNSKLAGNIVDNAAVAFNGTIGGNGPSGYSGTISGSGSVTFNSTFFFSGTGTDTATGGTTIGTGGNVQLDGALSGDVADSGTLQFNGSASTYTGSLTGTGSVIVGTNVIITGSDTITGGTTVYETLQIGAGGTAGSLSSNVTLYPESTLIFDRSDTSSYSGSITYANNTGSVIFEGGGTLTLTGSDAATNTTIASGSTLDLGTGGSLSGTVTDDGAVTSDGSGTATISGPLSGPGTLSQQGSGTLVLDNNDSVVTTITSGILQVGTLSVGYGSVAGVTDDASLVFALGAATGTITGTGSIDVTGGLTLSGVDAVTGGTTIEADAELDVGNGSMDGAITGSVVDNGFLVFENQDATAYTGNVTGTGGFYQIGSATLTVTGAISVAGGTYVDDSTLQVGAGGTAGSVAGAIHDDSNLVFDLSNAYAIAGAISQDSADIGTITFEGGGTYTLTAADSTTGTTAIVSGSTLEIGGGGSLASNVTDNGALIFARSDTTTYAASVSGTGGLTQAGTGTLILTGTDAIATTISAGTLEVGTGGAITGNITDNAALVFAGAGVNTFAGTITGTGTVVETGNGTLVLTGSDAATGGTTIATNSIIQVGDSAMTTAGSLTGAVSNSGTLTVLDGALSGANIKNKAAASVDFNAATTATGATINNQGGQVSFSDTSSAGTATLANKSGSTSFYDNSNAGTAAITTKSGLVSFFDSSSADDATLNSTNGGTAFYDTSTAGSATITAGSGATTTFADQSQGGAAAIVTSRGGTTQFENTSTAGGATLTTAAGGAVAFYDNSTGGTAALVTAAGATVDFSGTSGTNGNGSISAGSIAGAGTYDLGADQLTITGGSSTVVSGVIQDGGASGGTGGSLVVAGSATLTLSGLNTYTGKTSVSGTLDLTGGGSIQASTKIALTKSGATLDISGASATEVLNKLGGVAGTVTDLGAKDLKIKVKAGTIDTYSGLLKDGGVAGGAGGQVELGGTGELVLNNTGNTYTGGTTIDAGKLDVAALGAAGTGTITFANPASNGVATLEIDAAALTTVTPTAMGVTSQYNFANAIAGATSTNQVIDLTSLAYVPGATSATVVNGTGLVVNDGSSAVTLALASSSSKANFTTASDGHGGTLVYDPPATTQAPATAKVDTSWIEMAMADFGGVVGDGHGHAPMHDLYGVGAGGAFEHHHAHFGKVVRGA